MKQIYIENFRVDISRCEVHRDNDIVSLEPKVLQVLLYLVKHQGEVVSRQTLLDEVWPNSVVEANALQRCIGQLRKAFLDDAKQQRVIVTYPKNGYSLKQTTQQTGAPTPNSPATMARIKLLPALGVFILLIVAFLLLIPTKQPLQGSLSSTSPSISQSTSQDSVEPGSSVQARIEGQSPDFYALYSPDEHYVVYSHPIDDNKQLRNLWIQDLSTNIEFLLTAKPGVYGDVAWSPDSQHLSFVESTETCSALKLISLLLPLTEGLPAQTSNLIDCRTSHLHSPQWIDTNNILLIETTDNSNQASTIINYDLSHSSTKIIFQQGNIQPLQLAYSSKTGNLAITSINSDSQQQLDLLSIPSGQLSPIPLALPEISMNEPWYPTWNQQNDGLIISSSEGIFYIGLDGSVSQQNFTVEPEFR